MDIPVDAFSVLHDNPEASTCICFSSGVPAILPYFTNQSFLSGFHHPPAAFACCRIGMSEASIRRGTRVSATYRGGGGAHSQKPCLSAAHATAVIILSLYLESTFSPFPGVYDCFLSSHRFFVLNKNRCPFSIPSVPSFSLYIHDITYKAPISSPYPHSPYLLYSKSR